MKILLISAVFGKGSTGQIMRDLQQVCFEGGLDCYVAYSTTSEPVPNGYQVGRSFSKKIHALLSRIGGRQAYFSRFATRRLLRYIDRLAPDVVHLHNLHSNYINLNMLLRYLAKKDIPTVATNHDCWFFTGGCFHYTANQCFKWKENCGHCAYRDFIPSYLFDNTAAVIADRKKYFSRIPRLIVTGVSRWAAFEGKDTVFKDRKIIPVHNGVDLDVFKFSPSKMKAELGLDGKRVILGPASKWFLEVNRRTFDYFCDSLPDDVCMLIFGCNGRENFSHPKVVRYGYTSNRIQLARLYSIADVMVNCTREETLSLINVEAQACGTPVVTFGGTGVQETVDNSCGFSVPAGDYPALFERTMTVLQNGKQSDKCREWVCKEFDAKKNYHKYIGIYNSFFE